MHRFGRRYRSSYGVRTKWSTPILPKGLLQFQRFIFLCYLLWRGRREVRMDASGQRNWTHWNRFTARTRQQSGWNIGQCEAGMEVVIPHDRAGVVRNPRIPLCGCGDCTTRRFNFDLVDRDLFDPNNPSAIEWNEGITVTMCPVRGGASRRWVLGRAWRLLPGIRFRPSFTWRFTGFGPQQCISQANTTILPLKIVMRLQQTCCWTLRILPMSAVMNVIANPSSVRRIEESSESSIRKEEMEAMQPTAPSMAHGSLWPWLMAARSKTNVSCRSL